MPVFYGTIESGLDAKRRVSIPAPFRNRIESDPDASRDKLIALFASPELDYPTIFGCTFSLIDALPQVQVKLNGESVEIRRTASKIFRSIIEHKIDETGRIVLNSKLVVAANLEKKAVFHGQGHFFEIWPTEDVDDFFEAEEASLTRRILMLMTEQAASGGEV
jgi:MraZ protein